MSHTREVLNIIWEKGPWALECQGISHFSRDTGKTVQLSLGFNYRLYHGEEQVWQREYVFPTHEDFDEKFDEKNVFVDVLDFVSTFGSKP